MKVYVDHDLCIGCGLCIDAAPENFTMNDDYKSEVIESLTEANKDTIQEAIRLCPTSAIKET